MAVVSSPTVAAEIAALESDMRYNAAPGVHTYHECDCGRGECRRDICNVCIVEKLAELKAAASFVRERG